MFFFDSSPTQVDKLSRSFGVDSERGLPVRMWRRAQENRQAFYDLRCRHPSFTLLPANQFSPHPERHSNSPRDVARFLGFDDR